MTREEYNQILRLMVMGAAHNRITVLPYAYDVAGKHVGINEFDPDKLPDKWWEDDGELAKVTGHLDDYLNEMTEDYPIGGDEWTAALLALKSVCDPTVYAAILTSFVAIRENTSPSLRRAVLKQEV